MELHRTDALKRFFLCGGPYQSLPHPFQPDIHRKLPHVIQGTFLLRYSIVGQGRECDCDDEMRFREGGRMFGWRYVTDLSLSLSLSTYEYLFFYK